MDLNPKVLANVGLYMQWRETLSSAHMLEDRLQAALPHMSKGEFSAYAHVTGMYDIAHDNGAVLPAPQTVHAESVPMPALTPERLAEMDASRG